MKKFRPLKAAFTRDFGFNYISFNFYVFSNMLGTFETPCIRIAVILLCITFVRSIQKTALKTYTDVTGITAYTGH